LRPLIGSKNQHSFGATMSIRNDLKTLTYRAGVLAAITAMTVACGSGETSGTTDEDTGGGQVDSGVDSGSSSGAVDTGSSSGIADAGSANDDTGSSGGTVDSASSSGTVDSGSSSGAVDTGSSSGAVDTGSSSGAVDTGSSSGPVDAGGSSSGPMDAGPINVDKYSEHSAACKTDKDCSIPCAKGACASGKCTFIPYDKTCLVELPGDKVGCYGEGMNGNVSKCLRCNPSISQSSLTSIAKMLNINGDTHGIKTEDLSKGGILWTLSSKRSVSGSTSLYFGDPKTHVYANDKHVKASATTADMLVPSYKDADPELSFWLWLATEESDDYDYLKVEITEGGKTKQVWHSKSIGNSTFNIWKNVTVPLKAYAGKTVKIVFTFDSIDGMVNAFEGAYIDDIAMKTGCCGSTSDCNDGNACSTDTCAPKAKGGNPVCSYAVKKECCNSAADCNDGKACTVDICSGKGGKCTHSAKPGCCKSTADCDDKNPCTVDHCPKSGAQCQHTNTCCKSDTECTSEDPCLVGSCTAGECTFKSTCCTGDAECDDFNTCTLDTCDKGKCKHNAALVPGCCSPVPWANEFETDVKGWTFDAAKYDMVWEHGTYAPGVLHDGTGALKFGKKGAKDFKKHTKYSYGYATSEIIKLQKGQDAELEIRVTADLKLDGGSGTLSSTNRIYVYMYDAAKKQTSLGYQYLNKVGKYVFKKDISPFAGQDVQIRIRGYIYGYSSKPVSGKGILIDSVRIRTKCAPKTCTTDKHCNPYYMQCTKGFCSGGKCDYQYICCKNNADCKSSNLCLQGDCKYGKCQLVKKPGCCMKDADCDDKAKCSTDKCSGPGGTCSHTKVAGCKEPFCGDGKCDKGKEDCFNCVKDCGKCKGCGAVPALSCKGKCGKYVSGAKCQCDTSCKTFKDCCPDRALCCGP